MASVERSYVPPQQTHFLCYIHMLLWPLAWWFPLYFVPDWAGHSSSSSSTARFTNRGQPPPRTNHFSTGEHNETVGNERHFMTLTTTHVEHHTHSCTPFQYSYMATLIKIFCMPSNIILFLTHHTSFPLRRKLLHCLRIPSCLCQFQRPATIQPMLIEPLSLNLTSLLINTVIMTFIHIVTHVLICVPTRF